MAMARISHCFIIVSMTFIVGCGSHSAPNERQQGTAPPTMTKAAPKHGTPSEPRALKIVQEAIEAHGGFDSFAIAKIGQTTMEIDGQFEAGLSGKFTKVDIFHWPGRIKRTVNSREAESPLKEVTVINGGEAWSQLNDGKPIELAVADPSRTGFPIDSLMAIASLESPETHLAIGDEELFDGRPAQAIHVAYGGKWQGASFFDKETHLCVASRKMLFDGNKKKLIAVETVYSDYTRIGPLMIPHRFQVTVDGKPFLTCVVSEVVFHDSIDEKVFSKPVAKLVTDLPLSLLRPC